VNIAGTFYYLCAILDGWSRALVHWELRESMTTRDEAARRQVTAFVTQYNTERLHSAIGYITPADRLAGRSDAMWATRDQRLEARFLKSAPR